MEKRFDYPFRTSPIEETIRAMEALRKQGKFKYLGISECPAATLRKASKVKYPLA